VHPDKCKHPHATSAFEVLGNANQQLQSEEVMHELRHVLTLARGAPAPRARQGVRGVCATAQCSLIARWGRCYLARELTEPQAELALALRCGRFGAALRLPRVSAGAGRWCACVWLTSPGRPGERRLGSAVGLVPLGTMGRGLLGRCRRAAHASGRCQRRLRQPWLGLLPSRRRLPNPDGSAMPIISMSPALSRHWRSYMTTPWRMRTDVGACM